MYLLVWLFTQVLCIFPENNSNPMIAYMIMTNNTRRAICNKGTMARRIEFNTTCKPEKLIELNDMLFDTCIKKCVESSAPGQAHVKYRFLHFSSSLMKLRWYISLSNLYPHYSYLKMNQLIYSM